MSETEQGGLSRDTFYELIATKTLRKHYISSATNASKPTYCIVSNKTFLRKKPDMILHNGSTKSGPVLGVFKLGVRDHNVGLGDPDILFEEGSQSDRVVWEHMRRTKRWSHNSYEFEYGNGVGGIERTKYMWAWKNRLAPGIPRDLELRVANVEDRGDGELLALFRRGDWKNIFRGSFFINSKYRQEDSKQDGKWELMVLLTALGILECMSR